MVLLTNPSCLFVSHQFTYPYFWFFSILLSPDWFSQIYITVLLSITYIHTSTHLYTHMRTHICSGISLSSDCFPCPHNLEDSTAREMSARHSVVSGWNGLTKFVCEWWRHWQFPKHLMSIFTKYCLSEMTSIACLRWLQRPVAKYFTTAVNGNGLLWSEMSLRTQCAILHQCTQLFQRNQIQHIQCRCNAHCRCMMILIFINFVEYKCSQVVFSKCFKSFHGDRIQ